MPLTCAVVGADNGGSDAVCGSCCGAVICCGAVGWRASVGTGTAATGPLAGVLGAAANGAGGAVASPRGNAGREVAVTLVAREPAAPVPPAGAPLRTSASNSSSGARRDALIKRN